jgi:hypothetical protein
VSVQRRCQQLLDTLFEVPAVELLGMPAQNLGAKKRLMRLKKAYRILQGLGCPQRKQDPCRRLDAVGSGAWRPGAACVIGWNNRLQSATQPKRNHRTPSRIGLKRNNTKIFLGWEDHRPTRSIVPAQFLV